MLQRNRAMRYAVSALFCAAVAASFLIPRGARSASADTFLLNDSHFHLTNYIQNGPSARDYVAIMGDKIGRSALFGIPLQQTWAYENSGSYAPTYYLQTDAPLYYYSFTDAVIATQYLSLPAKDRARLDPMITGFNPADMYAVDHIRRVLTTFPGVFEGIGEFSIHKEFVSAKIAGNGASLSNPALDRVFDFAAEAGLLVLLHCDIDTPFDSTRKGTDLSSADEGASQTPSGYDGYLGAHGPRPRCQANRFAGHHDADAQQEPSRDPGGIAGGFRFQESLFRYFLG